jgi:aldehyde:ferredoxin oxidoreductase
MEDKMAVELPGGYTGIILSVDLTKGQIVRESLDATALRNYVGGTGLGIKFLYDGVIPGVRWSDPENRLIVATGPLNGTSVGGSGGFSVVTKGCLTNGATSVQAMGFLGAYLKFCGFDGIVLQGAAPRLTYLYINDGHAELRDATHLAGKDTWETESLIKKELDRSEREVSVFSIGPAGENLVKFACLVGDRGHVAAHNGVGAVMGSKRLKAIAVARGKGRTNISDSTELSRLARKMYQEVTGIPGFYFHKFGTLGSIVRAEERVRTGILPIKNYTTNIFLESAKFSGEYVRAQPQFELDWHPCWACKFRHCHLIRIAHGPFAGCVGEEPEYETYASFGPLIGNTDLAGTIMLANYADRLGLDGNESGWIIAWLMECYEKGIIDKELTDGLEMKWGDVEAAKNMLDMVAQRHGIGDVLADGVKNAAQYLGGEAEKLAIYTGKGNTPRSHDHRGSWSMMLDTCISDVGTDAYCPVAVAAINVALPPHKDPLSAEAVASILYGTTRGYPFWPFGDCLVVCHFNKWGVGSQCLADLVKAATGWNFTADEAAQVGLRVVNLLRAFNIRHGHSRDLDRPSTKYCSIPQDGPHKGVSIRPVWDEIVDRYYELMGWDKKTGRPLPDTLKSVGLGYVIKDIW